MTGKEELGTLIVTGASRGIGAAVAWLAGERGYAVAVNFSTGEAEATTGGRRDCGRRRARGRDSGRRLATKQQIVRMFETAERELGPIKGLVNNAAITGGFARVEDVSSAAIANVFAVNVSGTILCAREAVRRMSTRRGGTGGAIVNISSRAAHTGAPGEWVHYAASKGAIDSFTIGLAREVATEGIRVNAVAPGLIETGTARGQRRARAIAAADGDDPDAAGGHCRAKWRRECCGCCLRRRRIRRGRFWRSAAGGEEQCSLSPLWRHVRVAPDCVCAELAVALKPWPDAQLSVGHFGRSSLQILPQVVLDLLRQARRVQDVAQLRGRKAAGKFQRAGQRRVLVAQQGQANLGAQRPLRVMADGFDECGGGSGALQGFDDGGFGEARIFQGGLPDARFFVEKQCGGDHGGAAAGQRDAFAEADRRRGARPAIRRRRASGRRRRRASARSASGRRCRVRGSGAARGGAGRGDGRRARGELCAISSARRSGELFDVFGRQVAIFQKGEGEIFGESGVCGGVADGDGGPDADSGGIGCRGSDSLFPAIHAGSRSTSKP